MAQEFKKFDYKYRAYRGTALEQIRKEGGSFSLRDVEEITQWPYTALFTEEYSNAAIHDAVYLAIGAEDWQKFRVSLKGLTTQEKLFCLGWWWDKYISSVALDKTCLQYRLNIIRVNNYLGALKRGGQLNSELVVQK